MRRSNSSLSGQIGLLVERATSSSLTTADAALVASIVQYAGQSSAEDGPKEVARAIRKRLAATAGSREFKATGHCLDLLEACAASCGHRFHLQLAGKRDLLDELLRLLGPKHATPPELQERILHLLSTWSETFKDRPELKEIDRVVRDLKSKGVRFPDPDTTYDSLTYANRPSSPQPPRPPPQPHPPPQLPADIVRRTASMPPTPSGAGRPVSMPPRLLEQHQQQQQQQQQGLTPYQLGKLKSELDQVCVNCRVFNELLTELGPTSAAAAAADPNSEDVKFLRRLNSVNRSMQQRLMELLGQVTNESVLVELLRVNDDLNSAFLRYDRFENSRPPRPPQQQPSPPPPTTSGSSGTTTAPLSRSTVYDNFGGGDNLIDFSESGEEPPPPPQRQQPPAASASSNPGNLPDSEAELREMERWMRAEGLADSAVGGGGSEEERLARNGAGGDNQPRSFQL